jgi:hypothetical protein
MFGAAMPKASINEYGNPRWSEDDVSSSPLVLENGSVDAKSQPATV